MSTPEKLDEPSKALRSPTRVTGEDYFKEFDIPEEVSLALPGSNFNTATVIEYLESTGSDFLFLRFC